MSVEQKPLTEPPGSNFFQKLVFYAPSPKEIVSGLWKSAQDAPGDMQVGDLIKFAITNSDKELSLRILVTGKTGQGKSTLINGLLGANFAREGAGAKRCTKEVEVFKKEINGVKVVVFDSPGLQDNTSNEEEYIRSMKETCQELSMILYCTKMTNTRLGDDDKKAMKKLTQAFGQEFWNHAVFVLTFANMEPVERRDERDTDDPKKEPDPSNEQAWESLMKRRFEGRIQIWKEELHKFLINEVKVKSSITNGIPVIPTGDHKVTRRNPTPLCLPDRDNWFQELWKACFFRVKEQDLFLKINRHRMTAVDEGDDDGQQEISACQGDDLAWWEMKNLEKVPVLVIPPTKKKKDSKSKEEIGAKAKPPSVKELKRIYKRQEKQPTFTPMKLRSANPKTVKHLSVQMDESSPFVSVSPVESKVTIKPPLIRPESPPKIVQLQSDTHSKEILQEESKPQLQIDQEDAPKSIPSKESTVHQKSTEEMSQFEDNSKEVVNTTHAPTGSEPPNLNLVHKPCHPTPPKPVPEIWAPDNHKELKLLVTGKTGVGKSTLVNGLLGKQVAKEGASATRCTTQVTEYKAELHGVPVTVFDSPGLQDNTGNEDEYISDMKIKCQHLSLVLYCTKMTNNCLKDQDRYAILKLTAAFGQRFWEYALLVLTFANTENVSRCDERDEDEGPEPSFDDAAAWKELEKKRFEGRLKIWKNGFHKFLIEEVKVQRDIVERIPVVPAGDHRETRDKREPFRLPDRENWFDEFWKACSSRMKGKSDQLKELEHKIEIQALERQAKEYKRIIEKQEEYIRQEGIKKAEDSAKLDLLLDKKPLKSDLLRIFKSSAVHSKIIGTALDVKVGDLPFLPQSTNENLILVFERWMDSNNDVTWRKIVQICEDYPEELGQTKVCVKRFFHQRGHEIFL